jgi:hypothetical protein
MGLMMSPLGGAILVRRTAGRRKPQAPPGIAILGRRTGGPRKRADGPGGTDSG